MSKKATNPAQISDIANSVRSGFDNGDLSNALAKLTDEVSRCTPEEWRNALLLINKELDKTDKRFGTVDIVEGDSNGMTLCFSAGEIVRVSAEAPTLPPYKTVENPDGSKIEFRLCPDGKEHPTKIIHPGGQTEEFRYDEKGRVVRVTQSENQTVLLDMAAEDGWSWHQIGGKASFVPAINRLNVYDDGRSVWTSDVESETKKVTEADGHSTCINEMTGYIEYDSLLGSSEITGETIQRNQVMQLESAGKDVPEAGDLAAFTPTKQAYNPVGPPGLGGLEPADEFQSEKKTAGKVNIDWRECTGTMVCSDGSTKYTYRGELADGFFDDTNFTAEERVSKDNKLLERNIRYGAYVYGDRDVDIKFSTPDGARVIEDVREVRTLFMPSTGDYLTIISTTNEHAYRVETSAEGDVRVFRQLM